MAEEWNVKGRVVRLRIGDILQSGAEAIVYYARPDLALGSGFGGAIGARGGPKIQEELKTLAPLDTTKAVVTSGGNLQVRFIIHAVGPRFQEEDLEEKLKKTMENALRRAEEKKVQRVAFPAMGVGFYGVPLDVSARVMLSAFKDRLTQETTLQEVIVCVRDNREYVPFQQKMKEMR
jgi:O-acetyl-ADP-ribose deacetylase